MYLNCHTYFSFKYGTLSVETLFEEAKRCGVRKLVLTDINNTSGYIELLRICKERRDEYDLQVALGIEFRQDDQLLYIGIAKNNRGFEQLNGYLSRHNVNELPLLKRAPNLEDVFFIYPKENIPQVLLRSNEYIGLKINDLNKLITSPVKNLLQKAVILHPITVKDKLSFNIHRLLRVIDQNTLLSKLDTSLQADPNEYMIPENELKHYFKNYPEVIRNTEVILEQCEIHFELGTDKNKRHLLGSKKEDYQFLVQQAEIGYQKRYSDKMTDETAERFERELRIINQKNFESYYLISNDIVQFAKRSGYEYVGRGSGANSMIAYCLGITDVDPIELDLYFERFLNPNRTSPPDFDMDFSWKDRDAIYEYMFGKYSQRHVALLGTHTTYKMRSSLRELGKVFGLPKEEIDQMVTYPDLYRNKDDVTRLIFQYSRAMQKIPANLSIHAGGVLITENPIYAYTATDLPPKGLPVVHFEMHNAEDMGIYKFDILSQRGLGHIKDTVQLIKKNQNIEVDSKRFDEFKKDPKIAKLLSTGRTMGCFYVESPAMRMLLGKLECQDYITLVAASSIIRPGVARSGMMRAYIERHHMTQKGQPYETIHPKMDELMHETYGVMVYQEDVIKVAHHFANITLADADILRRGMSGKFRSRAEFKRLEDTYFDNCREIGYPEHVAKRVWFEIESFSGYSFSKGHSASYAVESYQSLFLKAHYPLEFMVGVINNFGGFYRTEFYFHEARMSGANINAPCINNSDYLTNIKGIDIYIGFIHLKSLETKIAQRIPLEREENGPYESLDDFIRRIPIGLEQLRILIRIDAFRFYNPNKKALLWEAQLYYGGKAMKHYSKDLFNLEPTKYDLPDLSYPKLEDAFDQFELLNFPLCDPFLLMLDEENLGNIRAQQLMEYLGKFVQITGYLVTTKDTSTKDGLRMHFGTFYDKDGYVFDTVHFPDVAKYYPFRGRGFYKVYGKVVEDFGYPMIESTKMERLPMKDREKLEV